METSRPKTPVTLLSVVVPCLDEADNLPELVERTLRTLDQNRIPGEVVLVDDGSRDRTAEVIIELEGRYPGRLKSVTHSLNLGIEASWLSGLSTARGAYACFIDADLQNQPEDIGRLYRELRSSSADIVQGVRRQIGRADRSRVLMSVGLNALLNVAFGMRARDNKSGFVVARREVLRDVLSHRHRYRYFQTFITIAAKARGLRIRELETLFEERIHGRSFMGRLPLRVILFCLVDIVKALHEFRFAASRDRELQEALARALPSTAPAPSTRGPRRTWLHAYLALMPLHHWTITKNAGDEYELLDRSQWLGREGVRELAEEKLRRLVNHAYWHVPHYRRVMDRIGLLPEDIRGLDDLPKLPLLSKDEVRERFSSDLMSDDHLKDEVLRITTSGSTGEPLTCWVDRRQLEVRWASSLRGLEWAGYRFGDPTVRLWHQNIGMSATQVRKEKLDAWLSRRKLVPAFEFDLERVRAMEDVIRRHRPRVVEGYAESFHFLAKVGLGSDLRGLGIRGVVSSAQTLDSQSRRAIEQAFGARVFDKYGSREFSGIAYECEQGSRHVVAESYVVELLTEGRRAKPGELGEVVVTDLNNYVMPFVRYRIGDLAYAIDENEPCPCGRGLPRIGEVEGRVQSIVLGANGCAIPSSFFFHLLKDYGYAVARFQIEQTSPRRIVFRYVPGSRFHRRVLEELFWRMKCYLGDTEIAEEPVAAIAMVRSGKYQAVINHLKLSYQEMREVLDPRISARG